MASTQIGAGDTNPFRALMSQDLTVANSDQLRVCPPTSTSISAESGVDSFANAVAAFDGQTSIVNAQTANIRYNLPVTTPGPNADLPIHQALASPNPAPGDRVMLDNVTRNPASVYTYHQKRHGRGHAILNPSPSTTLPEPCQERGVTIGDVVIVTDAGRVDTLFNVYLSPDDPINARGRAPPGFRPISPLGLPVEAIESESNAWRAGEVRYAGSVSESQYQQPGCSTRNREFRFEGSASEGAILVLPRGGSAYDLLCKNDVFNYIRENAEGWYPHIINTLGRTVANGSLYVVTGVDKTQCWGTGVFHGVTGRGKFELCFREISPIEGNGSSCSHAWDSVGYALLKEGPVHGVRYLSGATQAPENQCVFIRGFKITLSDNFWMSLLNGETVQITSEPNLDSHHGHATSTWKRCLSWPAQMLGLGSPSRQDSNRPHDSHNLRSPDTRTIISTIEPQMEMVHPSQIINSYLLQQDRHAKMAATHDDVWCSAISDHGDFASFKELLEYIRRTHNITRTGDVIHFGERPPLPADGMDYHGTTNDEYRPNSWDRAIVPPTESIHLTACSGSSSSPGPSTPFLIRATESEVTRTLDLEEGLRAAFIPSTLRNPDNETEGMYTTKNSQSSFSRILNMGLSPLDTLGQIRANLPKPTTTTSSEPSPAPSGLTNPSTPTLVNNLTSPSHPLSSALNTLSSSPAVDPDHIGDFVRTDEVLLQNTMVEFYELLETSTEGSLQHTFAKSLFGLMALFLYELNREDDFLDVGISHTVAAFDHWQSGGISTVSGGLDYTPIFVRSWAYGQRLKAQRDKEYDILDLVIPTTALVLEDCDQHATQFAPRAVTFLSVELSECYLAKYRATGDSQNLDRIIHSLGKFSKDPPPSISSVIGNAYFERFRSRGDIEDLDNCLQFASRGSMGLDLPGTSEPNKVDLFQIECCHLLSLALHESYQQHSEIKDLQSAIVECQNAISRLPKSHFLLSIYEADLADCLSTRFLAETGSSENRTEYIERAFKSSQSSLSSLKEITPAAIPPKVIHGSVLALRGAHTNNQQDLTDAISLLISARKEFIGRTHLESHIEYHLSRAFQERYRLSQEEDDLDMALYHAKASVQKAEPKAPRRGQFILHLGQLFAMAWKNDPTNRESHISSARKTFMDVLSSSGASITRLQAAVEWATLAEASEDPAQALEALKAGLWILPELAWIGHGMSTRYKAISDRSIALSRRAVSHAIRLNHLELAVQVLESGRSVIWSKALRPRNQLTSTSGQESHEATLLAQGLARQAHEETISSSELMNLYRRVPPGLLNLVETLQEGVRAAHQRPIDLRPNDPEHLARVERDTAWLRQLGQARARFRRLNQPISLRSAAQRLETLERERTAQSITPPPELELRHNPQLLAILQRGFIVVLNIYEAKCDAIILSSKEAEITLDRIPLPNISAEDAYDFVDALHCGIGEMYTDSITPGDLEEAFIVPVLQELWYRIVNPVFERIGELNSGSLPRIWWYTTGPLAFLPIHAAGPYTDGEDGLPELSISSYISSIQSLLRADSAPASPFHMLGIGQPETPGQPPLPAIEDEMKFLRFSCQNDPGSLTTLVGQDGNVLTVKQALPNHTWLHFSGHAVQDQQYPFDSALYLHDGPLKLAQLMQLDLSSVQFAFLSACMTSQGDPWTPDENIHLAAGLHFAGARSVVGTMWSVDDVTAVRTSREVYKYLFRNGIGAANPREAAEALHIALNSLKDNLPLYARVPIMHAGL